jgi:FAD/FMN-containing dehydrogenase
MHSDVTTTHSSVFDDAAVQELRKGLGGEVILPSDASYNQARTVWNADIDQRPSLIVRCAGVSDVLKAVHFARERDLLASVRGGGHNIGGLALRDGAMMINLSPMRAVIVEPGRRVAHAQGGATYADLDRETQAFGLATTGGAVSSTGIAGLTLGGGMGWLMGKYGLACDNLRAADVVTADGRLITTSASENEDLFWALRGGGGNFGVVTRFEYALHPVTTMVAGLLVYPLDRARDLLRVYRDLTMSAPDELIAHVILAEMPGMPGPVALALVSYLGSPEDAARAIAPLRAVGAPLVDTVQSMRYIDLQQMLDSGQPGGFRRYWKSLFALSLSDELIDAFIACYGERPGSLSWMAIENVHGAATRIPVEDTAFARRANHYSVSLLGCWSEPSETEAQLRWTRSGAAALMPHGAGGGYMNYMTADEGQDRVMATFGPNYSRLIEVKKKYDPTNFFRINHNIRT